MIINFENYLEDLKEIIHRYIIIIIINAELSLDLSKEFIEEITSLIKVDAGNLELITDPEELTNNESDDSTDIDTPTEDISENIPEEIDSNENVNVKDFDDEGNYGKFNEEFSFLNDVNKESNEDFNILSEVEDTIEGTNDKNDQEINDFDDPLPEPEEVNPDEICGDNYDSG